MFLKHLVFLKQFLIFYSSLLDNFSIPVIAALRTYAMRHFGFMAAGAENNGRPADLDHCPAPVLSRFRSSSLRYTHLLNLHLILVCFLEKIL